MTVSVLRSFPQAIYIPASRVSGGLRRYYNPPWFTDIIPSEPYDPLTLRHAFEKVYCLSPSIVNEWLQNLPM
jgi:hypothetical protein